MEVMYGVARRHPQTAYAGLKKSLQQEWDFFQRVNPGIRDNFCPSKEDIQHSFLLDLLRGETSNLPAWGVSHLQVNQAGIALPNPTLSVAYKQMASCVIT